MLAIRPHQCPMDIHEATQTRYHTPAEEGHTVYPVSGGYDGDGPVETGLEERIVQIVSFLQLLGFRIKSVLVPSQVIQYVGLVANSTKMTISIPNDRLEGLDQACQTASNKIHMSVCKLARLRQQWHAVLPAPLCYRNFQQSRTDP